MTLQYDSVSVQAYMDFYAEAAAEADKFNSMVEEIEMVNAFTFIQECIEVEAGDSLENIHFDWVSEEIERECETIEVHEDDVMEAAFNAIEDLSLDFVEEVEEVEVIQERVVNPLLISFEVDEIDWEVLEREVDDYFKMQALSNLVYKTSIDHEFERVEEEILYSLDRITEEWAAADPEFYEVERWILDRLAPFSGCKMEA